MNICAMENGGVRSHTSENVWTECWWERIHVKGQYYWRNEELQGSKVPKMKEEMLELGNNSDRPILR